MVKRVYYGDGNDDEEDGNVGLVLRTEDETREYMKYVNKMYRRHRQHKHKSQFLLRGFSIIVIGLPCLFIYSVMESPLQPLIDNSPTEVTPEVVVVVVEEPEKEATRPSTRDIISDMGIKPCLSVASGEGICYYETLWSAPREEASTIRQPFVRAYFSDSAGGTYYTLRIREEQHNGDVLESDRLIEEKYLVKVLEGGGESCVCPFELGIHDNTSFLLYHDIQTGVKQWVVMNDHVVTRHSNKRQHTLVRDRVVAHYEEITVSFDSPAYQPDTNIMKNLEAYNNEIIYYNHHLSVLRRMERESIHRISVHLGSKDAACYMMCSSSSPPSW